MAHKNKCDISACQLVVYIGQFFLHWQMTRINAGSSNPNTANFDPWERHIDPIHITYTIITNTNANAQPSTFVFRAILITLI